MRSTFLAELSAVAECACGASFTERAWRALTEVSLEADDGARTELRLCDFCDATLAPLAKPPIGESAAGPSTVRAPASMLGDLREATRRSCIPTMPVVRALSERGPHRRDN